MKGLWVRFVEDLALDEPQRYYSGPQKILHGVMWKVPGPIFFDDSLSLSDFGYADNGNKMTQLKRNYYNRTDVRRARQIVKTKWQQRSYGSAGFTFRNIEKASQDFCLQSATVTHFPSGGLEVVVFYRVTEPIKKFGADIIFLRESILGRFDRIKSIERITFVFSCISWHPMFICTYLSHHPDPIGFMESVEANEKWHKAICKWAIKYLFEGETDWVQKFSVARQNYNAMKKLMDKDKRRDLEKYFEQFRD